MDIRGQLTFSALKVNLNPVRNKTNVKCASQRSLWPSLKSRRTQTPRDRARRMAVTLIGNMPALGLLNSPILQLKFFSV